MPQFDHEKLKVYQTAMEFVVLVDNLGAQLPKGRAYVTDQLQRAALSIPLNIAEGAGEFSKREKARFYRIALRSGTECAALLDVCQRLTLVDTADVSRGLGLLHEIVAMLTRMIRNLAEQTGKDVGKVD